MAMNDSLTATRCCSCKAFSSFFIHRQVFGSRTSPYTFTDINSCRWFTVATPFWNKGGKILLNIARNEMPRLFGRLCKEQRQHGWMIYVERPTGNLVLTDHFVHVYTPKIVGQLRQFYISRHNLQSRLLLVFTLTSVQYSYMARFASSVNADRRLWANFTVTDCRSIRGASSCICIRSMGLKELNGEISVGSVSWLSWSISLIICMFDSRVSRISTHFQQLNKH